MREIVVNDKMQQGYRYILTAPAGRDFDPEFAPELTPAEMLALGVFGGKYMTDCRDEFPAEWFVEAKLSPERKDPSLNFFGIDASLPLSEWQSAAGSIPTTRGAGSSGTAATTWAGGCPTKTRGRSAAGRPCAGTWPRSAGTATRAT